MILNRLILEGITVSVTESSYREESHPTSGEHQQSNPTELNDSDYPPVYGEPVFGKTSPNTVVNSSPLEAITEQCEPSTVLVDNHKVGTILKTEGFGIDENEIKSLNIFPSPMDAFQYALYSFGITDVYIVLMINIRQRTIYGHHVLDLTQNYSLADDLINRLQNKDFLF